MKVLLNHSTPFMLTHGGTQTQIEQTEAALKQLGVEVEPLRWWDDQQDGDILHHVARPPVSLVRLAQRKNWAVVAGALESGGCARPAWARFITKTVRRTVRAVGPRQIGEVFSWDSYRLADACVALTPWEAHSLVEMFGVRSDRVHTVPNGVEQVFLESQPAKRGPWLVCTAALIEMKQVLKLAQLAVAAQTPVWIIGKPHAESGDYAPRFVEFARQHPKWVRYDGPISDRQQLARVYREARGFALLSRWEGLSLSALEAAACECPLLLSDLPWATSFFGDKASYCPATRSIAATAPILRAFYEQAPHLPPPAKPLSWLEVGQQLKTIYEAL